MTYSRPVMSYSPDIVLDENGEDHYGYSGTVVIGQTGATVDPSFQINDATGERIYEQIVDPEAAEEYSTEDLYLDAIRDAYP